MRHGSVSLALEPSFKWLRQDHTFNQEPISFIIKYFVYPPLLWSKTYES